MNIVREELLPGDRQRGGRGRAGRRQAGCGTRLTGWGDSNTLRGAQRRYRCGSDLARFGQPMSSFASLNRRQFLSAGFFAALAASLRAADGRPPRILLRSSWQTVNIGDIAHTPGVLRLLEDHLPEAEVTLWPAKIDDGVEEMLRRRFPKVRFALDKEAVARAFDECDFLLHGSGPSLVGHRQVAEWKAKTGKPYGVYGITIGAMTDELRGLLTAAKFAFFRDTVSLQFAKDNGVACPVMEFGPDGAFAVDLRNDAAADKFLKEHDLARGNSCAASRGSAIRRTGRFTTASRRKRTSAVLPTVRR